MAVYRPLLIRPGGYHQRDAPPHHKSEVCTFVSRGQTPLEGGVFPKDRRLSAKPYSPGEMSELTRNSIIDPVSVSDPVDWCSASDLASRAQQRTIPEVPNSAPSLHRKCP